MFKVDIGDILAAPGLHKQVREDRKFHFDELDIAGETSVDFKISNAGQRILVEGRITCSVRLLCTRCLANLPYPVDVDVCEEFIPRYGKESDRLEELPLDQSLIFTYFEERIDLQEVIRQNVIAAIPIKTICRPDCEGLCPQCGKDLNEGPCSCASDTADARWAPLLKLKKTARG